MHNMSVCVLQYILILYLHKIVFYAYYYDINFCIIYDFCLHFLEH